MLYGRRNEPATVTNSRQGGIQAHFQASSRSGAGGDALPPLRYPYRAGIASWIAQFIRFNDTRHPEEMGRAEIERFLSHLAINRNVAASTRNQVLAFDLLLIRNSKCVR